MLVKSIIVLPITLSALKPCFADKFSRNYNKYQVFNLPSERTKLEIVLLLTREDRYFISRSL